MFLVTASYSSSIFFWIILIGTVLILAAAVSPALARRRDLLDAGAQDRS